MLNHALIVTDIQNDFCPGGALAIHEGDQIIEPANQLIRYFQKKQWLVILTRDWHPANHMSFLESGGIWPPHCVAGQPGAQFHPKLYVPEDALIVSKATQPDKEAYSSFEGTIMLQNLRTKNINSLVILGLATDYCVKNSVLDALKEKFQVMVVKEAIRAVNVNPNDGAEAIAEMQSQGARFISLAEALRL